MIYIFVFVRVCVSGEVEGICVLVSNIFALFAFQEASALNTVN